MSRVIAIDSVMRLKATCSARHIPQPVSEEHLPLLAAEELTCSENRKSERLLKQVIRQEEEKMFCLFSAKFIPQVPSGTPFT